MMDLEFDERPIVLAIAGPNGAGKSTFFGSQLSQTGLPFINADLIAARLRIDAYAAAQVADLLRRRFVANRTSFVFETVFSDPVGDKVDFLANAAGQGYIVALCFVGIENSDQSIERVAMRVSRGGHDVPDDKLKTRYSRTMDNLGLAIRRLPHVIVFDNSNLLTPYRHLATFHFGHPRHIVDSIPNWLKRVLPE